jgi:hypothetical protein
LLPDTFVTPLYRIETFPGEPIFETVDSLEARGKRPSGFGVARQLNDFNNTVKTISVVEKRGEKSPATWVIQDNRYQRNTGRLTSFTYTYPCFPGEIEIARCIFEVNYVPAGQEVYYTKALLHKPEHLLKEKLSPSRFKSYHHPHH